MRILRMCAGPLAVLLLAGCAAAGSGGTAPGHVTGRLVVEGGALGPDGQQPRTRPIPGTLIFSATGHQPVSVRVGSSGRFTVQLPPGRYRVTGTCAHGLPVTVTSGHTAKIRVACLVP